MLKLLLIIVITLYILSKIGKFLFGVGMYQQSRNYTKPPGGNVNVNNASPKKNESNIKGGEYIDFEEVK